MAEQLQNVVLTAEQLAAAASISDTALQIVESQYGTGFPHFSGGQEGNLAYHNGYHTVAVPRDAKRVGQALGFSVAELVTADIAGHAHDLVQLKPRGVMEAESAEWYEEQIRRQGLPEVMAQAGGLAIKGTEPMFDGNRLVGQRATELEYPSKSAERVGLSVACGDFGELYTPLGPLLSHKLYQEIKGVGPGQELSLEGLAQFEAGQVALRQDYRFPLAEASKVLATHRGEVIAYSEELLSQLERGDITSWAELEAQDLAFIHKHSG